MMPSAPPLAQKHPVAGYPTGSDSIKAASKLSFSIDSLVGAAKCPTAKPQVHSSDSGSSSRPGSAQARVTPSPPQTQTINNHHGHHRSGDSNKHQQSHHHNNHHQQQQQQSRGPSCSPPPQRRPQHAAELSAHHQAAMNAFLGVRNPGPHMGGHHPSMGQHPFGPHLGFLNNPGAARSPFDYQSAAFYPWLLARQGPLGHMHGKLTLLFVISHSLILYEL